MHIWMLLSKKRKEGEKKEEGGREGRKVLARMWRNWNLRALLVECKMMQLLWKMVWQFFKILNVELP